MKGLRNVHEEGKKFCTDSSNYNLKRWAQLVRETGLFKSYIICNLYQYIQQNCVKTCTVAIRRVLSSAPL
jgi:hypothetical protein